MQSDIDISNDISEFKTFIHDEIEKNKENKKISIVLEKLLYFLTIAKTMSECPKYNFSFNDVLFLKKDWMLNEEFTNKYPSFLYWLSLNDDCLKQLQRNFEFYICSNEKMPFWLFIIRIISSTQCIEFYCKTESEFANIIKDSINSKLIDIFSKTKDSTNSKLIGTDWVNFLLPKVPIEISNSNYKLLYQFLINILSDTSNCTPFIKSVKEKTVKNFALFIINKIFNGKIDDFLKLSFSQKNTNKWISFVNKCIKELNIDKDIFHKLKLFNNTANEVISKLKPKSQ